MIGLDLSHWNSIEPARIISAGFDFAIIKASEGVGWSDSGFSERYNAINTWNKKNPEKRISIGAYHYLRAITPEQAEREASYFVGVLQRRRFDMPLFVDIEENSIFEAGLARECVEAFCNHLEGRGYWAGFYCSERWVKQGAQLAGLSERYTAWIANWSAKPTTGDYPLHQFTNSWEIDGKRFDANYCYIDFPKQIKLKGLNGYKKLDLNGDGDINTKDLVKEMKAVASKSSESAYDLNGDGNVDAKDLINMMKEI